MKKKTNSTHPNKYVMNKIPKQANLRYVRAKREVSTIILGQYVIFQLMPSKPKNDQPHLGKTTPMWIINSKLYSNIHD